MSNQFIINNNGISGSLTHLTDGSSYLVAKQGIQITSQSNGQIIIASSNNQISGIYGDGHDGHVVISSETVLTSELYCMSLFVSASQILRTNGRRIFVRGQCVISGTLDNSGHDAAHNIQAGALCGLGGGDGGTAQAGLRNGESVYGGISGVNARGGGGYLAGEPGYYNVGGGDYTVRSLPFALSTIVDGIASVPGGGGGGASASTTGGGGGGGVILLVAASIKIATSGSIKAVGGNGAGDYPGGSGSGGGGLIILVSQSPVQNDGTINVSPGIEGTGHGGEPGGFGLQGLVIELLSY